MSFKSQTAIKQPLISDHLQKNSEKVNLHLTNLKSLMQSSQTSPQQIQKESELIQQSFYALEQTQTSEGPEQSQKRQLLQVYKKEFSDVLDSYNSEVVFEQELLKERNQKHKEIEQKMQEVKEALQYMSSEVKDQGLVLDRIDDNFGEGSSNTQKAVEQLKVTDRRQRNKKSAFKVLFVLSVLVVVVVIIVVTLK